MVYKVRASSLAAYVVREVSIEGEHISAVDASGTIVVANETTEIGSDMSDTYVVTYTQGEVSEEETLKRRTDTVTNTMQSLIVNKTDLNNHPLKNAVFTLLSDDKESEVTGYESIISSESASGNLLNNIYLSNGTYYLKEINPPTGYIAPEHMLKIIVDETGISMVTDTEFAPRYYIDLTPSDKVVYTFSVENNPGVTLPSTGGPGTSLIYLLGALLTGISVVCLVMRKRIRST